MMALTEAEERRPIDDAGTVRGFPKHGKLLVRAGEIYG